MSASLAVGSRTGVTYWVVDNRLTCVIEQFKKCWSRGMTSQSRDDVIITRYDNFCAFKAD